MIYYHDAHPHHYGNRRRSRGMCVESRFVTGDRRDIFSGHPATRWTIPSPRDQGADARRGWLDRRYLSPEARKPGWHDVTGKRGSVASGQGRVAGLRARRTDPSSASSRVCVLTRPEGPAVRVASGSVACPSPRRQVATGRASLPPARRRGNAVPRPARFVRRSTRRGWGCAAPHWSWDRGGSARGADSANSSS